MTEEWPGQPDAPAEQWPGVAERPEVPMSGPGAVQGVTANYPAVQPAPDPGRMQSILHAFGEGAQEGVGPERFGLSEESVDALRKAGIFRGEGQNPIWAPFQGFNEGIIRPAAAAIDYAWRALQGAQKGTDAASEKAGLPPPFDTGFTVAASMGFPIGEMVPPKPLARGTVPTAIRPIEGSPNPSVLRSVAAKTGIPEVDAVLDHPTIKSVIDNAVPDRSHTIPYEAGGSVPIDRPTTYIDKNVPETFTVNRLSDASKKVTFDTAEPVAIHENVEEFVMDRLIKAGWKADEAYRVAHFGWAEEAEQAWYRFHDIDPDAAEAEWKRLQPGIQHEIANDTPADLYHKEYPGGSVTAARHEDVFEARPTPDEMTRAREAIRNDPELRRPDAVAAMQQARDLGVIGPEPKSIAEGTAEEAAKAATDHPGVQRPPPDGPKQTPWKDRFDEFVGKLKTSDDVKALIIKSAEENGEFQVARAGDIPLAQADKLSEATGIPTKDMDLSGMGRLMKNDAQVRAAMQVMIKTNDDLHFAMQKVAAKNGVDDLAELGELQEARMRRSLAVEQIAGLRAEWGRTGKAFQDFMEASKDTRAFNEFLKDKKGETIDDLRDMAKAGAALDPRTELPRVLNDARREPPGALYWTWVQGLISGIITHTKYLAANELYSSMERGVVTPIAAIIGKARQAAGVGSDVDRVFFGQTAAGLWGQYSSVPTSLLAAGRSVAAGMRVPLEDEVALYKAAIAKGENVPAPIKRAVEASELPQARPIPGVAGRIIGFPGDAAGGIHTFYKLRGRQAAMESVAYREAAKEGLSPISGEFWQRQQWHVANPTDDMRAEVIGDAYKATFMQELGPHAKAWQRLTREVPGVKWVFPFAHIPINLMKATYEGTPFAFMDGEMRNTLTGGKGQAAQDTAIARMVAGSSVMGYFALKALNGQATGDYPDDPKERDAWKLAGKEPNSILIGDYWMSYNKFGPAGDLANIGANIAAVVGRVTKGDDDAMTAATWKAAEAAGHLVADEVGFQSLQNLFEAMRSEQKGIAWAASTASSFLPFSSLVSQTASVTDPYMRQAKTFSDGLKYRIPGLRETLTPKRDWSGQPIDNPQYGNIIRQRRANTDPVDQEMGALGIHPAPPQDRIGGVKLPPAIYDQYQSTAGPYTRSALERLVQQPGWSSLPAYAREEVFRKTISATRQSAAAAMQMAYPQLIQTAVQNKINRLSGVPPKPLQQ